MELTIYDIIKAPVISDKAYRLSKKFKKSTFKVHVDANKSLIRDAVEKLFNVKVKKINCMNRLGKTRMVRRKIKVHRPSTKIAIVTLKEGYTINLFEQAEARSN